jgi:type II secretory pathway component PulF
MSLESNLSIIEHILVITASGIAIYQAVKLRASRRQSKNLKGMLKNMLAHIPFPSGSTSRDIVTQAAAMINDKTE